MSGPWVSIIIDNFNYARFVGTAIRSALDQTYERVEVIVVDDGSTDDSVAVIRRFGERITAIFQPNRGQSVAFDAGFRASRGDIIIFLDADDALRPDAVASIVDAWRPGAAKGQWCLASVDGAGQFLGNVFPNFPTGLTSEEIRRETLRTALYWTPPTSGNAYARWFLDRVLPLYPIQCGADGPLNTVAPLHGETITIDRPLGYYRVHGGNDGAQGALSAEKFARFIRMDQDRVAYLRQHAEQRGFAIEGDPLDRAVLHLKYRLASLKLLPARHPVAGETLAGLSLKAVRAALSAPDRLVTRLCLTAWFLAVAASPLPLAERLITWRFVPTSRSQGLSRLLRRLGVLRGTTRQSSAELSLPASLAGGERPQPA
jgi:glycosyltransferase involved in cell wall biosynthesis